MAILLLLFLLALPIILYFLLLKIRKNVRTHHIPPGPRGLPFIGNLHQLDSSTLHQQLWKLSQRHGPLMSLQLGSVPTLVVSSAKLAKQVLKTHDLSFCSRPSLLGQQKLSYKGLDLAFSPYNQYWREMRKVCVLHLFSPKCVLSFRPVREDEVSKLVDKISQSSSASKIINLSEMMMALTSTIICRIGFGKSYDMEGCERSRFHGLFNEAEEALARLYVSDYFPLLGWIDRITGKYAMLEKNFKQLDLFYQEIIDEHLDPKRPPSMQPDILDILLQLKNDQLCPFDLTLDHIKAILMDIIIAGTDTSAATVVWAMAELMKNPKEMERVQGEVRGLVLGNKRMVDEDDIQTLPYLRAVVKETMRLNPPDPFLLPRETIQSCVIDGYEISPKTLVYVNVWAIGRDRESWENPEEFDPGRFVDSEIDYKGNDFELIPFGAGRRGCPGMNLGALTVELTLANLLYSFDWGLPVGMKKEDIDKDVLPDVLPGITMHKKTPLCLLARNYVQSPPVVVA